MSLLNLIVAEIVVTLGTKALEKIADEIKDKED